MELINCPQCDQVVYFDYLGKHEQFRVVFGDERQDYGQALERHYDNGPGESWQENFISAYASSHPHED